MTQFVKDLSDAEFEKEVLKADTPVLVDFWAPWCGPCKSIAPLIEELAKEYQGRVKFAKINVDNNKEAAIHYNVHGIPNLILFKNGQTEHQIVGAVGKPELVSAITKVL